MEIKNNETPKIKNKEPYEQPLDIYKREINNSLNHEFPEPSLFYLSKPTSLNYYKFRDLIKAQSDQLDAKLMEEEYNFKNKGKYDAYLISQLTEIYNCTKEYSKATKYNSKFIITNDISRKFFKKKNKEAYVKNQKTSTELISYFLQKDLNTSIMLKDKNLKLNRGSKSLLPVKKTTYLNA